MPGFMPQFGLGFIIGLSFLWILMEHEKLSLTSFRPRELTSLNLPNANNNPRQELLMQKDGEKTKMTSSLDLHLDEDLHIHHDDDSLARDLYNRVKVLIWVMTSPQNLQTKAKAVKNTWAKRCNKAIFFSSEDDADFPTIGLNVSEGREHLTAKSMKGFRYVYEHYFDEYDWFMKADDDTYIILENLRYFLSRKDPTLPVFFGQLFTPMVNQGYYQGGAGYVLSKEALRLLATRGYGSELCQQDGGAEDVEIGRCLEKLGVPTVNSTDSLGRTRFHVFDPSTHLFGKYVDWYKYYDLAGSKKGAQDISDYAISFHYMSPWKMHSLEYYVYHLRPYGIIPGLQSLNVKKKQTG